MSIVSSLELLQVFLLKLEIESRFMQTAVYQHDGCGHSSDVQLCVFLWTEIVNYGGTFLTFDRNSCTIGVVRWRKIILLVGVTCIRDLGSGKVSVTASCKSIFRKLRSIICFKLLQS
jgi:hypothetical protein